MSAFRRARPTGVLALCLAFLACEQLADPSSSETPELFQTGSVADAASHLDQGAAAHAAVTLAEDGLLARIIRLSPPAEREALVSPVTGVTGEASGGTMTLALGGLEAAFTGETEFTTREGEAVEPEIALARLNDALSGGGHPWVELVRAAPSAPQAPEDPAFVAAAVRLMGEADARQIRLNVDWDNLVRNGSPPPDGWLAALGLRVEIRVSEGLTRIELTNDALPKREFEGRVASVDLETRWLTLEDGTVIQTVDDTEHALHDRGGGSLSSLEAVAQALDAGLTVFAAGVGIVRSEDPPVLVALRLHLFLRAELAEFHGRVTSVDLSARTFTLEDGTTVRLFAGSVICFGDDPVRFRSLEAVAEALAAGHAVNASGLGAVLSEGALLALRVSFGRALREFEGLVLAVDLVARTVELEDGTIVRVPPNPAVVHRASDDGDRVVLHSLEAVAEALEAGKAVLAAGVGTLESSDPVTIAAVRVVFFLKPPPVHRFEGPVASVDLDARTVTLESGTLIRVPTDEVIHHEGDDDHTLASLAAVAEAVAAGTRVVAHGVGELESEEPRTLVATKVIFSLDPPGLRRFEGTVASVDLDARTLRLEGGTLIRLTDDTRIHGANAPAVVYESNVPGQLLPTLEAVARALEAGATVYAAGAGPVETEEPLTIVAAEIAFFARPPVLVFFQGAVASVNLDARTVTLEGDRVLALSESSEIVVNDHALPSLAAVAEALAAGKTVIAAGVAAPPLSEGGAEQVVKVVFVVAEG